jgi:hypothetical protein
MTNTEKSAAAVKETLTSCGSCRYLNRHKVFDIPCVNTGKIATSVGCSSHSPDVFALVENSTDRNRILDLSTILVGMNSSQLAVLSELLVAERKTRKKGFYLGQRVYVRLRGQGNYFSNFAIAHVLMVEKEQILLVDEGCAHHWYLDFNKKLSSSLYTEEQFQPLREEMYNSGSFIDPEIAKLKARLKSAQSGIIQSMDEADSAGIAPKRKKPKQDLVDMTAKLTRGYIRKSSRDYNEEEDVSISYDGS